MPCTILTGLTIAITAGACMTEPEPFDLASCDAAEVYRIDALTIPQNNAAARDHAFDLDGNHAVDNQIGMVTATLQGTFGFDLSASATTRLATDVTWQLAVRRCPAGEIAIAIGPVDRAPVFMIGEEREGELIVRGAGGTVPVAVMFDPDATFAGAGWITSARTELRLAPRADGGFDGRLGAALPGAEAFETVVETFAPYMDAHIDDVPEMREQYDDNRDGRITIEEVREDSFTKTLLSPDLELDGARYLSLGVGLAARR